MRIRSYGFTLIEILLTIAIIISLSSASYFAFVQFNKGKNLNIAYGDFVNILSEAKSDSLSQVNVSLCTASQTLVGYQIVIDSSSSPNSYRLEIVCATDIANSTTYTPTQIKKKDLPSDVTISMAKIIGGSTYSATSFIFLTPNGLVGASYSATLTSSPKSLSVGIDSNGVILQQ